MSEPKFKCIECGTEIDEDYSYCDDCYEAAYGEDDEDGEYDE